MARGDDPGLLLGKQVAVTEEYAPELLCPITRSEGRDSLGLVGELPFDGVDVWHAYELSWLDKHGIPQVAVGEFRVPADSPNIVESKSLKLYLHSLNNLRLENLAAVADLIARDVGAVVGAAIAVSLQALKPGAMPGSALPGSCLDHLQPTAVPRQPDVDLLRTGEDRAEEQLYTHLLRSLCPVTGQPDWATLWLSYAGPQLDREGLLAYLLGYRQHQEFHEQCVERVFCDLLRACNPEQLTVQALYTRRGGLDICPLRSNGTSWSPLGRIDRQ